MKTLAKLVIGAALAGGLAFTSAPASAGVHVGVGIGVPAPVVVAPAHRRWCWRHPGACRGGVYVAGPRIGVFYHGRGWWDGHRYWTHRYWRHGRWWYR
ncbi:MAG TPA: hypothetical protein VHC42_05430 [Rhizomicrobium sp.]|nr:hypothetical protein [Rhizomicrobium sp.]